MAGDDDTQEFESDEGELMIGDEGDDDDDAPVSDEEIQEAAKSIDLVVLPIACTNEGKGAPLAMGIQRWLAQELAQHGARAAAPVFTALHEQNGRQIPALMVFREPWTDERALEGIGRFPNAKLALIVDIRVDDENLSWEARFVDIDQAAKTLSERRRWTFSGAPPEMAAALADLLIEVGAQLGHEIPKEEWQKVFGTGNVQALVSFLVGLGNLSALQGRCVPTTSQQLLAPLIDAINRAPEMDVAMQALHAMVDILVSGQPDQGAIPLSIQALNLAAQRRKNDQGTWHHLAIVLRRVGDIGGSISAYQQAINLGPQDQAVAAGMIDALRGAGDSENAFKVAKFAVENGNEGPVVMAQLASLMIEGDQFDEAEPFLRRAIEEGKVPSAYGDLANVLWDRDGDDDEVAENHQEALALLGQAVQLPQIHKSALDMLLDLHEEEKVEAATELLLKAAELHPENAGVLRYVASMYLEGDNPEAARPYLQQILSTQRRSLDDDAFARRALLTLEVADFEDLYDDAIDKVRSDQAKAQAEAAVFLRKIIAREPRYWQPHLMLALAVRGTEGDGAALAHLMDAVRLRPNDVEIRSLLAAILRRQGRPKEAVEHLRVVVALNPREIDPVVNLAACMRDANMFDEARQVCQAALQMIPNHPEFKRILDSLPPAQH
ncbi:MAG: tetratricopeptide repeat protein [Myxococcales bacterium]|nr:tetratricopeptide repeat protein [Myxococcales bacterium]MCB9702091.1 tetratricopeptide repeat protein [Myxococcales bacterium]